MPIDFDASFETRPNNTLHQVLEEGVYVTEIHGIMETAKPDAQENELFRRQAAPLSWNAGLTLQQQPFDKPWASSWQEQQQPFSFANTISAAPATTSLDLSQLTPAQLISLQQQQQGGALLHQVMPRLTPQPPQQPVLSMNAPQLSLPTLPMTPQIPVYNGVNPNYPGLRVVNRSPPMFAVDQFLTPDECQFLIQAAHDSFGPAPVVGKGAGEISQARTSSTCYLAREDLPSLMRKVCALTGKPVEHCELPQVGRYFATQQYLQHYDAFDMETEDGVSKSSIEPVIVQV